MAVTRLNRLNNKYKKAGKSWRKGETMDYWLKRLKRLKRTVTSVSLKL